MQAGSAPNNRGSRFRPPAWQGLPRWHHELGRGQAGHAQGRCSPRLFGSCSGASRVLFGHPLALPYQARQLQKPDLESCRCGWNLQVAVLPVCLRACLSVCPSVCLSVCLYLSLVVCSAHVLNAVVPTICGVPVLCNMPACGKGKPRVGPRHSVVARQEFVLVPVYPAIHMCVTCRDRNLLSMHIFAQTLARYWCSLDRCLNNNVVVVYNCTSLAP